ncbi:MAG TPA: hypothetical protein PLU87_00135 [Sedimentisphaerales bacterium]|nr:hypothetical protein [Sedimentisphaerales bacterium]HRS09715.1 hypothetical protein [Sedimentisphaerales bacterium]HRV46396.1 hypothetical protein [Sedimentisphaerales bacterium]
MMFDHDGLLERLPAARVKALIERWKYRMEMEELVRPHATDMNAAMRPVDHVMSLLHGGAN